MFVLVAAVVLSVGCTKKQMYGTCEDNTDCLSPLECHDWNVPNCMDATYTLGEEDETPHEVTYQVLMCSKVCESAMDCPKTGRSPNRWYNWSCKSGYCYVEEVECE